MTFLHGRSRIIFEVLPTFQLFLFDGLRSVEVSWGWWWVSWHFGEDDS